MLVTEGVIAALCVFDRVADIEFIHEPFVFVWFLRPCGGQFKMCIFLMARNKGGKRGRNVGSLVFVYKSLIFHASCHAAPFDHWPVCC